VADKRALFSAKIIGIRRLDKLGSTVKVTKPLMPLPRNDKCREILASNASCKFKVLLLHDLQIMV